MAIDLLDGKQSKGEDLNSCTGVEGTINGSEPETLPGIEYGVAAETMIGEATIAAAFAEAGHCRGPQTILLVEDEAFVRKVTAEVLESAGYRLVIAGSAAEALEAYRGCGPPDLVLADVVMPGMSGRELASELESFYPRARILLMSGYAEQLARCELSPYGLEYLAKPFSIRMLLKRVRAALDKPLEGGHA
jgi:two-component system, cell cycle sensor histidine kinase and response regulator CckA